MTYTWQIAITEDDGGALVEKIPEICHCCHSVKEETNKVREYSMRNAIESPRTVVVHFENTPTVSLSIYRTIIFRAYSFFLTFGKAYSGELAVA